MAAADLADGAHSCEVVAVDHSYFSEAKEEATFDCKCWVTDAASFATQDLAVLDEEQGLVSLMQPWV